MNCCNNCFDAGCVDYCQPTITLDAVAPADGVYKLAFYLGSTFLISFQADFLAGEPLAFNLDLALNSNLEYNIALLDGNNTLIELEDSEGFVYNCFSLMSTIDPAKNKIEIPLEIA